MWTVVSTPDVTVVAANAPDSARGPDSPRGHAHAVLIRAVSEALGHGPAELAVTHRCPRCGATNHGIPSLTHRGRPLSLAVSISRAPGLAVVGWGSVVALGVDIERAEAAADPALNAVLLHPAEPVPADADERTQAWVRKEAALKAWGSGLNVEPSRVLVTNDIATIDVAAIRAAAIDVAAIGAATADAPPIDNLAPVCLINVDIPGYQACVARRLGEQASGPGQPGRRRRTWNDERAKRRK